jgi:hypothetical protein
MGSSAVSRAVIQIVVFHYRRIILLVGCTCCVLIMFNKLLLGMLICVYGCKDEAALRQDYDDSENCIACGSTLAIKIRWGYKNEQRQFFIRSVS